MIEQTKKRVIFFLPALTVGGAEKVTITFINNIDRSLYEPILVTVKAQDSLLSMLDKEVSYYCLNSKYIYLSILKVLRILRTLKPDIIYSTMAPMNFIVLLSSFFVNTKIKFVIREAVTPSYFFENFKYIKFLIYMAYRFLYPRASVIVAPSPNVLDELKEIIGGNKDKYHLLVNPIHYKDPKCIQNLINPYDIKKINFLSVGRLCHQKGYDRLVNCLANTNIKFDWCLSIIGDGEESENLMSLVSQLNLNDKIKFLGHKENFEEFYIYADRFLLTSRFEGLPNVVLESLSFGLPVISMREVGGIEFIDRVSQDNCISLASNMSQFSEHLSKVKKRENVNTVSLLSEMFSLEKVMEELHRLLR